MSVVTVRELRAFLASQPDEAEVRLAGVEGYALVGWVGGGTIAGEPVAVLAFDQVSHHGDRRPLPTLDP